MRTHWLSLLFLLSAVLVAAGLVWQSAFAQQQDEASSNPELQVVSPPIFGVTIRDEWTDPNARTRAKNAGVKWARTSVMWAGAEPTQGNINLAPYDAQFRDLAALGMTPLVYISNNPSWASSSTCGPLDRAPLSAFANFARALAERYDGDGDYDGDGVLDGPAIAKVDYWQPYNEVDNRWTTGAASSFGGCWGNAGAQYAQLLRLTWDAIHQANPDAKLMFGALAAEEVQCPSTWECYPNYIFNFKISGGDFFDDVLNYMVSHPGHQYFDILDVHYYAAFNWRWNPYGLGLVGKVRYYTQRMQNKGISRPMMVTEAGRRSDPSHVVDGIPGSDEEQSRWVVRLFVQGMAARLQALTWFSLADVNTPAQGGWQGWGLLDQPNHLPKPSHLAYKTLTQQLGSATYVATQSLVNNSVISYRFTVPDVGDRTVLWVTTTGTVNVSFASQRVHTTDKWGVETTVLDGQSGDMDGRVNGSVVLAITGSPIYVDARTGAGPTFTPTPTSTPTNTPTPTITPTPTNTPTPMPPTFAYVRRVNAGGNAYTDANGLLWEADQPYGPGGWGYVGGWSATATGVPAGALDPLYMVDRRWDASAVPGYRFTVPNGQYEVRLKFVETEWDAVNKRKFNVVIEGTTVLTAFDIYKAAGGKNIPARDRVFTVLVSDGELAIDFVQIAGFDRPKVNAIQVRRSYTKSLNSGGDAYRDSTGQLWLADQPYSNGFGYVGDATGTAATTHEISGTSDPVLYQSERNGTIIYRFKVPNGRYRIQLRFSENEFDAPGMRVFDVGAEGVVKLRDFDIYATVGQYTAYNRAFEVDVTDAVLDVFFTPKVGVPKVSAIRVTLQ